MTQQGHFWGCGKLPKILYRVFTLPYRHFATKCHLANRCTARGCRESGTWHGSGAKLTFFPRHVPLERILSLSPFAAMSCRVALKSKSGACFCHADHFPQVRTGKLGKPGVPETRKVSRAADCAVNNHSNSHPTPLITYQSRPI